MDTEFIEQLVIKNDKKIIFLILDGLGGLPQEGGTKNGTGGLRLQLNLDRLAAGGRLRAS